MDSNTPIQATHNPVFWGEIAPCEHIAQFYEHDGVLLDTLAGFVGGGLKQGEGVIVLATGEHLKALDQRLEASGINLQRPNRRTNILPSLLKKR